MKKKCGMWDSREKGAGMRDQDPPSRPCRVDVRRKMHERLNCCTNHHLVQLSLKSSPQRTEM